MALTDAAEERTYDRSISCDASGCIRVREAIKVRRDVYQDFVVATVVGVGPVVFRESFTELTSCFKATCGATYDEGVEEWHTVTINQSDYEAVAVEGLMKIAILLGCLVHEVVVVLFGIFGLFQVTLEGLHLLNQVLQSGQ